MRQACDLLGLSPSSYYYRSQMTQDQRLEADLKSWGQHPTYGTRRLMHQLRRKPYGYRVNRKRIQRLARKNDLLRPVKRRKVRTTDSQHPYPRYENLVMNLDVVSPDLVWVSDITYIRLKNDFVYLAIVVDVFTRSVRGWCLSRSIDQQLTLDALEMALQEHTPQIHQCQGGSRSSAATCAGRHLCLYVVRDDKAVVQAVTLKRSLDGQHVAEGNLRAGEPVLIEIPQRLKAGSKVKLEGVSR